ncbi:MAG: DeoR family transcriptional regulator [Tannerellaceae bacterium]|nr:DeoR family transcriptional regulator [Tannerellaceae bacterium]
MTITYHYFKNPGKDDQHIHPRVVNAKKITISDIGEKVTGKCSFTASDVKGVMDAVKDVILDEWKMGNYIHWDEFANISLVLESEPVTDSSDMTPSHVKIKGIRFELLPDVKKKMRHFSMQRSTRHFTTTPSPAVRQQRILSYLRNNENIQSSKAAAISHCSRGTASKDLQRMEKAGLIRSYTGYGQTLYALSKDKTP